MKQAHQVAELDGIVAFIGYLFYANSPRYIEETSELKHAKKVGVFVNANLDFIQRKIEAHALDYVQLHGNESVAFCNSIHCHARIIKAFGIGSAADFKKTIAYSEVADYFLFDTKSADHGGTGKQFNWEHLHAYSGNIPFFLSGGITTDSVDSILALEHPQLVGIDLNSGFELAPGNKNIHQLKTFIHALSSSTLHTT